MIELLLFIWILNCLLLTDNEDLIEDGLSLDLKVRETQKNLHQVKESVIWEFEYTYLLTLHKPSLGKESIKYLNGLISPEMQINVCPQSRPNYRNFHTFFGRKILLPPSSVSAFNYGWINLFWLWNWHLPRFFTAFASRSWW